MSGCDVSVYKDIMSCFSFLGSQSSDPDLLVPGCTCSKQTVWTEDQLTVISSEGIRNHEKRVVDIVVRELKRTKPLGYIQSREVWSTEEDTSFTYNSHFLDL